jgi:PAS domain S-box-containing protein
VTDYSYHDFAEGEERFRSIFMSSPNGMAIVALDGMYLRVNPALCDIVGYSEAEVLRMKSQEITHPDDLEKDARFKEQLHAGEITHYRLEKRYRHKNGNYVWVYVSGSLVKDAQGKPLYRVAEIEDILQRKIDEAELEKYRNHLEELVKERTIRLAESESRVRTIMDSMLDGLVTINTNSVIEAFNPAAEKIFGYSAQEVIGMNIQMLMPDQLAVAHKEGVERYLKTNVPHIIGKGLEVTGQRKDGRLIPLDIAVSEARVAGKHFFTGIIRDISERKKVEDQLRTLALVVQEIDSSVIISDKEGRISWVNPFFTQRTGYLLNEVIGKRPDEFLHGEETDPETASAIAAAVKECRSIRADIANYSKDGRKFWVEVNLQPVFDSKHAFAHFIGVSVDITERKSIEHLRSISERNSNILKVVAEAANASRSPEEVFRVVVDSIARFCGWPLGHVCELDAASGYLTDTDIWHVTDQSRYGDFIEVSRSTRFAAGEGLPGQVMNEKTAMWWQHVSDKQMFLRAEAARAVGITTAVAFPVIVKNTVVAVIEFFSEEHQLEDSTLLDLMQQIGIHIGIVIERTETEQNLLKLYRAVENSPATVIITDHTGAIEYANPKFEQNSGYSIKKVIGKNPRILKSGVHSDDFYAELWMTLLGGNEWHGEFCNRKKNGELYWESASISPIKDEDGVITNFVAVKEDITARRQNLNDLEQARDAANAANRSKGEFLANMSHEIRTPLNAILGFSNLAQKQEMTPALRDYIKKIHSAGLLLLGVVNDILDFSKIEAGKMDIEKTRFKLEDVMTSVISVVQQKAIDSGIELLLDVSPDISHQYLGDPLRISQILTNLMSNAIKFTHQGEVELIVVPLQTVNNRVKIQFSVRDTGIGMNREQIGNLFQAFTQADGSTTRKYGGTGLGLSICKRLVEMMGGEIWAESELGKGSVFHFTIWLEQNDVEQKLGLPQHLAQKRVLIVDDNRSSRKVLHAIFSRLGARIDTADTGNAAVEAVRGNRKNDPYQLILMDWSMSEMDGIEATRLIKSDTENKRMPSIIVITAFGRDEEKQRAFAAGADGYLHKPLTASSLVDEVIRVFDSSNKKTGMSVVADNGKMYDFSGYRILVAEDNEVNQQIVLELLQGTGAIVELANNGREAWEKVSLPNSAYDLILMDIQMPEMDGEQATKLIRADERIRSVPVIAMTAHALLEKRAHILAAGMDDVITKPIDPDTFYAMLGKYLLPNRRFSLDKKNAPEMGLPIDDGFDRPGAIKTLVELFNLVDSDDAVAEDYFKANQQHLSGMPEPDLLRLETSLANYNYTTAREVLLVLANRLGVQLKRLEGNYGQK